VEIDTGTLTDEEIQTILPASGNASPTLEKRDMNDPDTEDADGTDSQDTQDTRTPMGRTPPTPTGPTATGRTATPPTPPTATQQARVPTSHRAVTSALERCVGDVPRFTRELWGRRPDVHAGADPGGFADLLTLDDVDAMVSSMALRLPAFRLIKDWATLPESAYTKAGRRARSP
jgi:hypothetical protein